MPDIKYHNIALTEYSFLITGGGAGFIGTNLVAYLLNNGACKVRVLDNLSNGYYTNVQEFASHPAFEFIEGDICNIETCKNACAGIDYVSHQAALGSIQRSINDPITTNDVNIGGFLNMLIAARDAGVKKMVFATSSSIYGDNEDILKIESNIGKPLSPYAVTKYVNELYAQVFGRTYGLKTIGLRYFNVFGPKQSPNGAYAAVIPLFINSIINNIQPVINGNGLQTRDFTFIENVIQANIRALLTNNPLADNEVYNIGVGESTSIIEVWNILKSIANVNLNAINGPERIGEIKNSQADISKAIKMLDYGSTVKIKEGLAATYNWFNNI